VKQPERFPGPSALFPSLFEHRKLFQLRLLTIITSTVPTGTLSQSGMFP